MIDIRNGELADLWPDETSPEFKSISYALHMAIIRMLEKAAGVGSSCDINHLAESTLDYLAVETRAMYYDQGADIETKRSIIKNTLKWYTQAGTVKATEELIASVFGGDARLIEWFDFTEPPIEANTFDVETEALMTKDIINELTSVIKKVKNSKSHIRRVTVLRELHSAATMATCITAINECTVSNHEISDTDATEGMNVAAVAAPVTETYALNTTAGNVQATAGAFIASATGTEGSTYVLNDNQGATEASGTIDVGPANASEESTHALNAETGKTFFTEQTYTAVAEDTDTGNVLGLYILHPNNIGRCGHICNASYAVSSQARGLHIGEKLVSDCLIQGKLHGFRILQFNAVVASNIHARHLYERLGFIQLGVIPGGFRMKDGHYEDICPYYHEL